MAADIYKDKFFLTQVKIGKFRVFKTGDVLNARGLPVGYITSNGYKATAVKSNGKVYGMLVHRLVYLVHVGPIAAGMVINHKDGNKLNNNLKNLEVVTYSYNSIHAYKSGLVKPTHGTHHPGAKLSESDVLSIRELFDLGLSKAELGRRFDISPMCIRLIVTGKSYKDVSSNKSSIKLSLPKKKPKHVLIKIMQSLRSTKELAKQYNIKRRFVCAVREGRKYKKLRKEYSLPIIPSWLYKRSPDGLYGHDIKRILCAGSPKALSIRTSIPLTTILNVRSGSSYEAYRKYFGYAARKPSRTTFTEATKGLKRG